MTIKTGPVKTEKTNKPAVEIKKGIAIKNQTANRPHEIRAKEKAAQSVVVADVSTLQGDRKKKI